MDEIKLKLKSGRDEISSIRNYPYTISGTKLASHSHRWFSHRKDWKYGSRNTLQIV
jgi:hypothetical protein